MEVFMFRKVLVAAGAAVLVAASLTAVPASAATKISNGVACKKAGATTKVSGSSYKCAKNPLVKNAKLTWLSMDCLKTADTYQKALANLPKIKAATDATITKLDADIITQQAEAEKANKLIPEYRAKIATINVELTRLNADTANLAKNKNTISKYSSAIRNYEAAIKAYETVGKQTDRSQKLKGQAQSQYDSSKMDVDTTLEMAKIICSKGF
jgi:DNA repair exonuclease SbcCD ATPase subunit